MRTIMPKHQLLMGKAGRPIGSRRIDIDAFFEIYRSAQKDLTTIRPNGQRIAPTQQHVWEEINNRLCSDEEYPSQPLSWPSFNRYLKQDPRLKPQRPVRIPDRREEAI